MDKKELALAALWVGAGIIVGFAAWTMIGPNIVAVKNNVVRLPVASTAA